MILLRDWKIGEFSQFRMAAATEGALPFSVAAVVEDVLQQHGTRSRPLDLDARRAEEDGKCFGEFRSRILVFLMWREWRTLDFVCVRIFLYC